jgi:dipeptidyl-peptidase-3
LNYKSILQFILLYFIGDRKAQDFELLYVYLKKIWFANGILHRYNEEKSVPSFSADFFFKSFERDIATKIYHSEKVKQWINFYQRLYM